MFQKEEVHEPGADEMHKHNVSLELKVVQLHVRVKCNKIARDQDGKNMESPTIKDVLRHNTVFERNPESDVGRVKSSKLDLEWTGARTRGRTISQETIAKSWVQDEDDLTQGSKNGD